MFFGKKKTNKYHLPFPDQVEEPKPMPSPSRPGNPLSEQYVDRGEAEHELKSYAIYYRDRDLASKRGDPMIAIVQAYSQVEAEVKADELRQQGYDVITMQSNEDVDFPTQRESEFAFPKAQSPADDERSYGADILRRKKRPHHEE